MDYYQAASLLGSSKSDKKRKASVLNGRKGGRPSFYVVYHHLKGSQLMYVGHGKPSRPYENHSRSLLWDELVGNVGGYTIKIVAVFKTKEDAFLFEKIQIDKYRPSANLSHTDKNTEAMTEHRCEMSCSKCNHSWASRRNRVSYCPRCKRKLKNIN